jgi:hypothetical protein
MHEYVANLAGLQQAIVTGDIQSAPELAAHSSMTSKQQLHIYISGYRERLHTALRNSYPAVLEYTGAAKFDELATGFIETVPSESYNLDIHLLSFATYISEVGTQEETELAHVEAVLSELFMLPEERALTADDVTRIGESGFVQTPLRLRTASRLLSFQSKVNEYLSFQRNGEAPKYILNQPQHILVFRHNHQIQRMELSEEEYVLLRLLENTHTVGDALREFILTYSHFAKNAGWIQQHFMQWISSGIFRKM